MDYYAGTRDTVRLPTETVTRLEAFLSTLPRAKYPEPEFVQQAWDKPGLPEALRPKATTDQRGLQSGPKQKPKEAKKYTYLDERKLIATINIFDKADDKWMSSGLLILEGGIRFVPMNTTRRYVLELNERSLAELKSILDSAVERKPNQASEPRP